MKGPVCASRRRGMRCGAQSRQSEGSPPRRDHAFGMSSAGSLAESMGDRARLDGRRVSQEAASGILVAALGALEAHFGSGPNDAEIAYYR